VLRLNLIGNPVEYRSGPAAVTPPSSQHGKGNPFGKQKPLFQRFGMGRQPKRAGEPEDLPVN